MILTLRTVRVSAYGKPRASGDDPTLYGYNLPSYL